MPLPFDPELIEEGARCEQIHGRTADALALAQAISLKRIADALSFHPQAHTLWDFVQRIATSLEDRA